MSDWKPIDTAPISNGSKAFLVHVPGHGCSVCYAGAGRFIYSVTTGRRIPRATHWMALPSPPEKIESGANAAANSPALCTEASPTRTDNTIGDGND